MKAKEMFEELCYKYKKDNDNYLLQPCITYYRYNYYSNKSYVIKFWLNDKEYNIEHEEPLTLDLVQAINKQIEELHWEE